MHRHTCFTCNAVMEEGTFNCEFDYDHDFGKCKVCTLLEQHGSELERGCASNTMPARDWLNFNSCRSVFLWQVHDDAYLDFLYRADVEVTDVPAYVHFDHDIYDVMRNQQ